MIPSETPADVSQLLRAWSAGEAGALDRLAPIVYDELHRIARSHMARERSSHTLQATALVNEAFERLMDCTRMEWRDRVHFYSVASRMMRRVLIDYARRFGSKRGSGLKRVPLEEAAVFGEDFSADFLALDAALDELAMEDERKCRVVELRFFGGMTVEETAEALGLSSITVIREWNFAKAWLYRAISGGNPE
ncbi:MAG: sigma-70 family RNA polymerase sigma factor [Bryobacterales bacterium]|nr:sigma-70 family RNA polymerase sigma factor [Bryobacterales bacterium]